MRAYRLCGLTLESAIPLAAGLAPRGTRPAVRLTIASRRKLEAVPPGVELLAQVDGPQGYSFIRERVGYRLRFEGVCEFLLQPGVDGVTVTVIAATETSDDLLSTLASGALVSVLTILDGAWPLHASAVERGGGALAIIGGRGMGKSTLAALLCRQGARLVTDDVLRVQTQGSTVFAVPGHTELRLRTTAADAATGITAHKRRTWDQRIAIAPDRCPNEVPLIAVLVPRLGVELPSERRLSPRRALVELLRYPRLPGWCDEAGYRLQFEQLADLVRRVPVYEIELPRIHNDHTLAARLIQAALARLRIPGFDEQPNDA